MDPRLSGRRPDRDLALAFTSSASAVNTPVDCAVNRIDDAPGFFASSRVARRFHRVCSPEGLALWTRARVSADVHLTTIPTVRMSPRNEIIGFGAVAAQRSCLAAVSPSMPARLTGRPTALSRQPHHPSRESSAVDNPVTPRIRSARSPTGRWRVHRSRGVAQCRRARRPTPATRSPRDASRSSAGDAGHS